MSAFILADAHIGALVHVAARGPLGGVGRWYQLSGWAGIGDDLLAENIASIRARYGAEAASDPEPFRPGPVRHLTTIEALKAVQCYEYQSCEHDAWEASRARKFCSALTFALVTQLPGYDAARWAIGE